MGEPCEDHEEKGFEQVEEVQSEKAVEPNKGQQDIQPGHDGETQKGTQGSQSFKNNVRMRDHRFSRHSLNEGFFRSQNTP